MHQGPGRLLVPQSPQDGVDEDEDAENQHQGHDHHHQGHDLGLAVSHGHHHVHLLVLLVLRAVGTGGRAPLGGSVPLRVSGSVLASVRGVGRRLFRFSLRVRVGLWVGGSSAAHEVLEDGAGVALIRLDPPVVKPPVVGAVVEVGVRCKKWQRFKSLALVQRRNHDFSFAEAGLVRL